VNHQMKCLIVGGMTRLFCDKVYADIVTSLSGAVNSLNTMNSGPSSTIFYASQGRKK